jgi:MoaA/NifB/PqqE/SkfB family radical SAM enzyme
VGLLEERYLRLAKRYLLEGISPLRCQALAASFFMDPGGDVYPCSVYSKSLGNIADFDYDIRRLWDSDDRRRLRADIAKGECPQCWSPCEAYQSILAGLLPGAKRRGKG